MKAKSLIVFLIVFACYFLTTIALAENLAVKGSTTALSPASTTTTQPARNNATNPMTIRVKVLSFFIIDLL